MSRPVHPHVAFPGLAVVFAAFFVAAGAPTPLLALQQRAWGFSAGLLTIAFSVYALSLLAALLVAGSLSDHLGRRPVLLVSIAAELVSMVTFVLAPNIGWLVVARAIQGLATGLATSVFSVAIVEQAFPHHRPLAGSLATASVAGGLGIGTLVAGAAVQLSTHANTWVFATLAAVMAAALVFVLCLPETAERRRGARASLAPRPSKVPGPVRSEFLAGVPGHIATWMFAAFFLGLAPAVLRAQADVTGGLVVGFTTFLAPFTAAVSTFVFARYDPRRSVLTGLVMTLTGMVVVLTGVVGVWLPVIWAGAVVGGFGFGGAFGGQVRIIAPRVRAHERAGLITNIYTVAYLAFGVPVAVVGQLVPLCGLTVTYQLYAAAVIALAAWGFVTQVSRARHEDRARGGPEQHVTPGAAGSRG